MSTVNFSLKGLAACYHKEENSFWTIIFPTDSKHKVKFTYFKDGSREGPIELADKSIEILSPDSVAPDDFQDKMFTKHVMDLTGPQFHKEGVKKNDVKAVAGFGERILQVPHAKLSAKPPREGRLNYAFPYDKPDDIVLLRDEDGDRQSITPLVVGSIIINDKAIKIKIEGEPDIELFAGDSFDIDNDCHETIVVNDFQLYAKLYSNQESSIKYEAISINDPTFIPTNADDVVTTITATPPNVCEITRISNTTGLV
jgi:hypothetical protein